jgi:hypothetical protein
LFVIPSHQFVDFSLGCYIEEKKTVAAQQNNQSENKDHSVGFYNWIHSNSFVNKDALWLDLHSLSKSKKKNSKVPSIVEFSSSESEEELKECKMTSISPVFAYFVGKFMGILESGVRMTFSDTFQEFIKKNAGLAGFYIGENYDLVVLCDSIAFTAKDSLSDSMEDVPAFCGKELIKNGVMTFPPLSNLWFIHQKARYRDSVLGDHMVPFTNVVFHDWHRVGATANRVFDADQNFDTKTMGLVAKAPIGQGGSGIFFLEYDLSSELWKLAGHVLQPTSDISKGTTLRIEPFFVELKNAEYRLYVAVQSGGRVDILYNVVTSRNDDGKIMVTRCAQHGLGGMPDNIGMSEVKQFIKKCMTKLVNYNKGFLWGKRQDLVLRYDIFFIPGQPTKHSTIYLNEVEIFPDAHSFLLDFVSDHTQLSKLSELTSKFIKTNISSWPM